jgi:small multidrug resistance pump
LAFERYREKVVMNSYFIVVCLIPVSVFLNTSGQILLKMGSGEKFINMFGIVLPININLLAGLVAYALSTVSYIVILKKLNVVVAYPVVFGLTIIATTFAGATILKEPVTQIHWMGVGLVIGGLCAIAFGKIS